MSFYDVVLAILQGNAIRMNNMGAFDYLEEPAQSLVKEHTAPNIYAVCEPTAEDLAQKTNSGQGVDIYRLTDIEIEQLKAGKVLWRDNGEFVAYLVYDPDERS